MDSMARKSRSGVTGKPCRFTMFSPSVTKRLSCPHVGSWGWWAARDTGTATVGFRLKLMDGLPRKKSGSITVSHQSFWSPPRDVCVPVSSSRTRVPVQAPLVASSADRRARPALRTLSAAAPQTLETNSPGPRSVWEGLSTPQAEPPRTSHKVAEAAPCGSKSQSCYPARPAPGDPPGDSARCLCLARPRDGHSRPPLRAAEGCSTPRFWPPGAAAKDLCFISQWPQYKLSPLGPLTLIP